ncbi:MAG: enoyl-CoA hydratase-related protein [Pseudomonadota bacterium]
MSDTPVNLTISDGIAHVELNRPDAGNAINSALGDALSAAARECDNNRQVRVILFSAKGKMFSVGGDLQYMSEQGDNIQTAVKLLADELHRALTHFARCDAPIVTAVQGTAAGAGFSMAIMGDVVVAEEHAKFTMAYTASGLSPDGGSTYYLPRLIGMRRAQELTLTNRVLTAQEAHDWGLITQVVETGKGLETARKICQKIASGSKSANADAKRLLRTSFDNSFETHLELEGREIAKNGATDGREGITAFFEKRAPKFS